MTAGHEWFLLIAGLCSILLLILLIARYKMNPFIVLFVVSLALALVAGMPAKDVVKTFEAGVGGVLGHIAIVIALGTMLGKMMAESGGAERIALTLIRVFGEKNVHWAMMAIGLIVGLPVFFEVGFVLLIPIAFNVAKRTNTSIVFVGIPMVAGLSVVHGLVPPHPAALLAVAAYNADIGRTILYALLVGVPTAIVAGPLFAKLISPRISVVASSIADQFVEEKRESELPGFGVTAATVLFPVVLMMIGSWADAFLKPGTLANTALHFLGSADISLLAAALASFVVLGKMLGFSRETILKFSEECLAPTASITLLIGAGGGFGRILQDSGISQTIVQFALQAHISVLVLAWLLAAVVRLATGSATVAMTTAAGIVAPIALQAGGVRPELLTLATGAGSLVFSHLNDGGFWLVKEYFGMSVPDTIKTWSISETIISLLALVLTLALSWVI